MGSEATWQRFIFTAFHSGCLPPGKFNESELDGLSILWGLNSGNIRLGRHYERLTGQLVSGRKFFQLLPEDLDLIGGVSWRLSENSEPQDSIL